MKSLVVQAEWKGKPVILKSFRSLTPDLIKAFPLLQQQHIDDPHTLLTKSQFIERANVTISQGILGGLFANKQHTVLESVVSECDVNGDGVLKNDELFVCWRSIISEEYILYELLKDQQHVPEVMGVCGDVFAVEYVSPLSSGRYLGYESILAGHRSWRDRARMAIALLDMIEFFEGTPYGSLHTCDVKETNYGISEENGRMVAKAIDMDHSWFGPRVFSFTFQNNVFNRTCQKDSDCSHMHDKCRIECDLHTGRCSDRIVSNYLQVCIAVSSTPSGHS